MAGPALQQLRGWLCSQQELPAVPELSPQQTHVRPAVWSKQPQAAQSLKGENGLEDNTKMGPETQEGTRCDNSSTLLGLQREQSDINQM